MSARRGPVPDRSCVRWEKALHALYEACYRLPVKQRDRTPEQQAAVEEWTTRMVQISELFNGPELGMMGAPIHDACSYFEFFEPAGLTQWGSSSLAQEMLNEGRERGLWWALQHPRHIALAWAVFDRAGRWWWWFR